MLKVTDGSVMSKVWFSVFWLWRRFTASVKGVPVHRWFQLILLWKVLLR